MNGSYKKRNKLLLTVVFLLLTACLVYGVGRLYFKTTGGFRIKHISSDFAFDPRWETRNLSPEEKENVDQVLSQNFRYLGKGCQSYVFESDDGRYVIKFFKYQRFRPQFYLYWFAFIPQVDSILHEKIDKKLKKRENLFASWRVAFDNLQEQSGLIYVHLNKTDHLKKQVKIIDKIGREHLLEIDAMEFLIQKKAEMLCDRLDHLMQEGKEKEAKELLTQLIGMIVSEYQSGFADNDHALMQNTGVFEGNPIHIDIGQFEANDALRDPALYHQELFNKTWKFRKWLKENHPVLLAHLDAELKAEMGERFFELKFIPKVR